MTVLDTEPERVPVTLERSAEPGTWSQDIRNIRAQLPLPSRLNTPQRPRPIRTHRVRARGVRPKQACPHVGEHTLEARVTPRTSTHPERTRLL
jgi:hypothetical protein